MNSWHSKGFFTYPSSALRLSSVFLRCLETSLIRCGGNAGFIHHNLIGCVAWLGWIYANGFSKLIWANSPIQSLDDLFVADPRSFHRAMEIVHLLTACAWNNLHLNPKEIMAIRIGTWLESIARRTNDIGVIGSWTNMNMATDGPLLLPLYVLLRATHPAFPDIATIQCQGLSFREVATVEVLEPRLHELGPEAWEQEEALLPPATENDKNYNLWYFYDHLQPEPF